MFSERDGDQNGSRLIQARCGCPIAFLLNPNVWIVPEHWAGTNCENTNISSVVVRKAKPITVCWHSCLLWWACQTPSLAAACPLASLVQWAEEDSCFWSWGDLLSHEMRPSFGPPSFVLSRHFNSLLEVPSLKWLVSMWSCLSFPDCLGRQGEILASSCVSVML